MLAASAAASSGCRPLPKGPARCLRRHCLRTPPTRRHPHCQPSRCATQAPRCYCHCHSRPVRRPCGPPGWSQCIRELGVAIPRDPQPASAPTSLSMAVPPRFHGLSVSVPPYCVVRLRARMDGISRLATLCWRGGVGHMLWCMCAEKRNEMQGKAPCARDILVGDTCNARQCYAMQSRAVAQAYMAQCGSILGGLPCPREQVGKADGPGGGVACEGKG